MLQRIRRSAGRSSESLPGPAAQAPRGRGPWAPLLAALALALVGISLACGPPEQPPNVLLVVLDTARADALSTYGGAGAHTPILDRLAAEGVLYTHARSTSAWTVPAHGSLFTGLYPSRHGAHHEHPLLAAELTTLAELLAPTHATAGFSENPHIGHAKGFAQGFDVFEETWRAQSRAADVPPTDERARAWLAARDRGRPFFLFLNFMAPHLPYAPPPAWEREFVPALTDPALVERLRGADEWTARQFMVGQLHLDAAELSVLRALYRAEVAFAGYRLGRVLDALVAEGELEHTLLVVVGDHGENIADHGLMEHQFCLYDTLLRVPLILRLPGTLDGGERRGAPVQLVDVPPTILGVAGVPREGWPHFEGVSLVDGDPPRRRPQVAEIMRPVEQRWRFARVAPDFDFNRFDRRLKAVVVGETKLIASERGKVELYDLAADPGEEHDLARERPELVARLLAWLTAWEEGARQPAAGAAPELDAETRRALKALGYLD